MARRKAAFTQTDLERALKAAQRAGLEIARTEFDPATGGFTLVYRNDNETSEPVSAFDEWKAKRNASPA